ncbi:hypothetical protein H9Y04_28915 [Streptomyces sp. TRM66268-LWL]|uniref:Uncharacterized protein n=1 Tax=Streptomyces polyasparticus TaxID=2767826 RepID=A0ABR7SPV2_9ACTN|nr:hypothetical protein [Streptomyces polyasparticus]MBC9716561.1 hypothetical protein [Streptomyces polyasparticus]
MHSVVLVCLPPDTRPEDIESAVAAALMPYCLYTEVDPWRDYETGQPHEHWTVRDQKLPATTTWAQIAESYNRAYPGESPMLLDEDGRAYRVVTYSPQAEFDWYQIGGRWCGYFLHRPEADGDPRLVTGERSWANEGEPAEPLACDGGPVGLLDLDAARARRGEEAAALYDLWEATVRGLPEARPFRHFLTRHEVDPEGYGMEDARRDYRAQPAVAAAAAVPELPPGDLTARFAAGRTAYVREARDEAVAGAALLTLEGEWIERPWGDEATDGTEAAYAERVSAYLDGLDPDAYVVCVDCHS